MKTVLSCRALAAVVVAASLGLQACGGETGRPKEDASGTGGRSAETGGSPATNETGGIASSISTGGLASTGGAVSTGTAGSAGSVFVGGGGARNSGRSQACDSLGPNVNYKGESTGIESCRDQTTHRVSNAACGVFIPRADWTCRGPFVMSCATDADCTEKALGGCFLQGQGQDVCDCEYRCRTDEDCEDGGICVCEGDAGKCVPATCRTDADCGEGLQCRSYQHPESDNCDDVRFECQLAEDTCDSSYEDCHGIDERCISDATGVHQCRPHSCMYN